MKEKYTSKMSTLNKKQTVSFRVILYFEGREDRYYFDTLSAANKYIDASAKGSWYEAPYAADIDKVTSIHFLHKKF